MGLWTLYSGYKPAEKREVVRRLRRVPREIYSLNVGDNLAAVATLRQ